MAYHFFNLSCGRLSCRELTEDLPEVASAKTKTRVVISAVKDCINRKKLEPIKIKNVAGWGRWHRMAKA